MDYRELYFELFRVQTDVLKILEETADKLHEAADKLTIAHLTAEEMFLSGEDDDV